MSPGGPASCRASVSGWAAMHPPPEGGMTLDSWYVLLVSIDSTLRSDAPPAMSIRIFEDVGCPGAARPAGMTVDTSARQARDRFIYTSDDVLRMLDDLLDGRGSAWWGEFFAD